MTTYYLAPTLKYRGWDNNGNPLVGGQLFTYQAGTSTKLATYQTAGGSANTNPVILNSRGECDLFIPANVAYKFVLAPQGDTDPPSNPIQTEDNIINPQLLSLYGGTDTGAANAYVVSYVGNFSAYQDGIVLYFVPSHNNTGASTINVSANGGTSYLGVVSITNPDGSTLRANTIVANQMCQIIYKGGGFQLANNYTVSGSFTGTLTGMSAGGTGTVNYIILNNTICVMQISILGTSNTTSMTLTGIPAPCQPPFYGFTLGATNLTDNGNGILGWFSIPASSGTMTFYAGAGASPTGFTASGSKGIQQVIMYPLV